MNDEKYVLNLRNLYEQYGYKKYKMSKFEEYDLYLQNKSFLESENIITFHSPGGKLLALKPDITLSIVKNTKNNGGLSDKVYYCENVYRSSKTGREIKEIMHIGLEYIGDVDLYAVGEVIMLAAKSLQSISDEFVLCISHMGLISGVLDEADFDFEAREKLLLCIAEKNAHEIRQICIKAGAQEKVLAKIEALARMYGDFEATLKELEGLVENETSKNSVKELTAIYDIMKIYGVEKNLRLDLSIMNDMSYYNGITFQGFINGVPRHILSGGRYDKLVEKLGKRGGAIGFAIYPDYLEHYNKQENESDVDVLLLYDDESDIPALTRAVKMLTDNHQSVRVHKKSAGDTGSLKYKQLLYIRDRGLEIIEKDD